MSPSSRFLFTTCQVGAESALKQELARDWPDFKFAYSRPGFLTFKIPSGAEPPDNLDLNSVFARAHGFSLGKATAESRDERAREVWQLLGDLPVERLHVWPRDLREPGVRDYEPGMTPEAIEAAGLIHAAAPAGRTLSTELPARGSAVPASGPLAADVILIDSDLWWVGFHRVHSIVSGWPGGFFPESIPADAVSRVYLKMYEAIQWAGFAIGKGDRVAEIGCAPGGASQVLLNLGASVIGIDPAEMHPLVLGHPRFRHIRRRSKEVRRSDFAGIHWLTCDINLPPNYTLDTVEAVVARPDVKLRGMLLTLKLIDWSMAAKIPEYLDRVRSWGFGTVKARQLHHNRREICVAASDFHPSRQRRSAADESTTPKPKRKSPPAGPAGAKRPNRGRSTGKPRPRST